MKRGLSDCGAPLVWDEVAVCRDHGAGCGRDAERDRHAALVAAARDVLGIVEQDPSYCFGCHSRRPCAHDDLRGALDGEPE